MHGVQKVSKTMRDAWSDPWMISISMDKSKKSEVEGVNREIDFGCACVCVACVRTKLRVRDGFAVARAGQMEVVTPSGRLAARVGSSTLCR